MPTNITPFLMFDGQAEEAMSLYVSLFEDAKIETLNHYAEGSQGPTGKVALATFVVAGQRMMCFDSPVEHEFSFTPANSLFVDLDTEHKIRRLTQKLSEAAKCSCHSTITASAGCSRGSTTATASPGSSISPNSALPLA